MYKRQEWHDDDFSRSVPYCPLVGLGMGIFMGAVNDGLCYLRTPDLMRAVMLVLAELLIIGALMYDGFMDTSDGVFSARNRERMLEIMKDSRTGSFGVVAFGLLVLMQYSLLLDMPKENLPWALLVTPVVGRLMMTGAISLFPYARPDGMGKAFGKYATSKNYIFIVIYTLLLLAILDGWFSLAAVAAGYVFLYLFGRYVTKLLGGLTGDVYGAVCTLTELLTLAVYLFV